MGSDALSIQGPLRATLEDFESLVECGGECFPSERDAGDLVARWPHTYRRDPEHLSRFLVMKAGGKVISNVTYVDQILAVDGGEVKAAGLAGVMTLPAYRGRGLMSKLLQYAIECIGAEGYALSDLGGDRLRYGRYGWESARRVWRFSVTQRSLGAAPAPAGCVVRPYRAAPEEVDGVAAIHDAEPLRVKRAREQYVRLLGRLGKEVQLALEGRRIVAYLVTDPKADPQTVLEFGGSAVGIHCILRQIMEQGGGKPVQVFSPWLHPLNRLFVELSADRHLGPSRMIRLFDLAATLRGFSNQLHTRWRRLGMRGTARVTLGIAESGEVATLDFTEGEGRVTPKGDESSALILPRREMVRFLFGPEAASATVALPPDAGFLDALLPLDFYIWHNEMV